MSSHIPFDSDMEAKGKYVYSGPEAQLSAVLANASQSRMVHKHLDQEDKKLVDVGCGDGFYTKEFLEISDLKFVLGIDLSLPAVNFANKNWGSEKLKFENINVEDIIKRGQFFDVAVVRGVLHHAEEPDLLLKKIFKIANKVIVLEPNGLNPILKVIERTSRYHIAHGEKSFAPKKLIGWIRETNFEVTCWESGVLVPFFCPASLARILSKVEKLAESLPLIRRIVCGANVFVFRKKE
jgi:SAM-dependent methyltransferase